MELSRAASSVSNKQVVFVEKRLREILDEWPKGFIAHVDLALLLKKTDNARYSVIKRALKSGMLVRLKRGLYLIANKLKHSLPDEYELALHIYGPSFVSLESALSYHGWIPEAVYTITCVTPKQAQEFTTPIGVFSYKRVPAENFYTGVNRIETAEGVIFVAAPWRALADLMYTNRLSWEGLDHLEADLRIDKETLVDSDKNLLAILAKDYPSSRVRKNLKKFLNELEGLPKGNG